MAERSDDDDRWRMRLVAEVSVGMLVLIVALPVLSRHLDGSVPSGLGDPDGNIAAAIDHTPVVVSIVVGYVFACAALELWLRRRRGRSS
jgi:hypothetical protein